MTKDQSAPGRLDRVREFVNTVDFEGPSDKLDDPGAAAWLEAFGFAGAFTADDLKKLRDFREAIRAVLLANSGEGELRSAWSGLAAFGPAPLHLVLDGDSNPALIPSARSGEAAVRGELFAIMYDAVRDGSWRRLKACRKHSCLWAYYDHSKNGSGAWCSMATCGNRVKAQRRRLRART